MPVSTASGPDQRLVIALDEAVRAVMQQQQALEQVKQRATAILSAAGLAAAFMGGLAARDEEDVLGPAAFVALGAFVALALAVLWILQPRTFTFENSPKALLGWVDDDYSLDAMRRHLATYLEDHYDTNQTKIDHMTRAFQIASLLLVVEVVALLLDLWGR